MTISSMTGFARLAFEVDGARFTWELKSVNGRGLDIRLKLPPGLDHLEPDIRAVARDRLARGSLFVALIGDSSGDRPQMVLNEDALALVVAAARRLAAVDGIAMPSADGLLAIPGVLQDRGAERGGEANGSEERDAAALRAFGQAITALKEARDGEGRRLGAIIDEQLETISRLAGIAESVAAEAPDILRARIREQVALLAADANGLDPDRLHQEAVIAATRADVREELDRLGSHVAAVRDLVGKGGAIGRRLEFLAQEFNREANTLCSKAFDRRLTAAGIELKSVIDQFREQVQNME